jgi:Tol biopolymer transport system component
MNRIDDLDRMLSNWLDDPYSPPAPHYLGQVLERTRHTRQRPAWTNLERWLPMADKMPRLAAAGPLRMTQLLLIALLVAVLAAAGALVGARLLDTTRPEGGLTYPIARGGEAVLAYHVHGDIFTVRADGSNVRQLTSGAEGELAPSWSPDGTRIAYLLRRQSSDLGEIDAVAVAVMDAGGGHRATLATTSADSQACIPYGLAAWSPDGKTLIFPISPNCDDRSDLLIVSADGSSPATRLLAPGLNGTAAAWSPDGTRIAFIGREATGNSGLYVVDVKADGALTGGLQARRITEAGASLVWGRPRWSPDGTELAAEAGTNYDCSNYDSGTMDAFIVKADGSGQRPLVAEAAKEYNPTWSPDGKQLAFIRLVDPSEWVTGRPCTAAIWVIDAAGTNPRRLDGLAPDPDLQPPVWSPDGTRLVGVSYEGGAGSLYFVTVNGGNTPVTVNASLDNFGGTWQPVAAPLPPAPSLAAPSSAS